MANFVFIVVQGRVHRGKRGVEVGNGNQNVVGHLSKSHADQWSVRTSSFVRINLCTIIV